MSIRIQRGYAGIQPAVNEAMRMLNHLEPVDLNKIDPDQIDSEALFQAADVFFNWQKLLYEAESWVADETEDIKLPPPIVLHNERQRLKRNGKLLQLGLLIYGPNRLRLEAHYEIGTITCPMCRRVLFPRPAEGEGLIPLCARIRVWDAAYQALGFSRLHEEEEYRTEAITFMDTWQKHRQAMGEKEEGILDGEYHHGFVLAMASLIDITRRPERYHYLEAFPDRRAALLSHMEKARLPYTEAEGHVLHLKDCGHPQDKKQTSWKKSCALALFLVVTVILVGRLLENHVSFSFTWDGAASNGVCMSQHSQSHTTAISTVPGNTGSFQEAGIEGDRVSLPPGSASPVVYGVSIAASVDPSFNRFLFDLSSEGVFRLRKSAGDTTTWYRNTYFTATASKGLSALWLDDYYGVWLYYTTSRGALMVQIWYKGGWTTYSTGLTVYSTTDLSAWAIADDNGKTYAWYVLCVDTNGALVEYVWNEAQGDKYLPGRTVDPMFNSTQPNAAFDNAFGVTGKIARAYYLSSQGSMERLADPDVPWTDNWWHTYDSKQPDTPGGAIAALSWANEEVRMYYMSGGGILEVGMSHDGGKWTWFCGSRIN
ncbi:MAG: hypothetical protein Q9220_004317 [cf. Caloplaca sp. 1 TL-2023]